METVEKIAVKFHKFKESSSKIIKKAELSEEEKINKMLDAINFQTKSIEKINECLVLAFDVLDDLSRCEVQSKEDKDFLSAIMEDVDFIRLGCSKAYSALNSNSVFREGCKSVLDDFLANIRTLREYKSDIEEKFYLKEDSESIDNLLLSF